MRRFSLDTSNFECNYKFTSIIIDSLFIHAYPSKAQGESIGECRAELVEALSMVIYFSITPGFFLKLGDVESSRNGSLYVNDIEE